MQDPECLYRRLANGNRGRIPEPEQPYRSSPGGRRTRRIPTGAATRACRRRRHEATRHTLRRAPGRCSRRCVARMHIGDTGMTGPQTLFEKIWNSHLVDAQDDGVQLLYIDRHLLHEVLSPQGVRGAAPRRAPGATPGCDAGGGRPQRPPPPTAASASKTPNRGSRSRPLSANCREFGVEVFDMLDPRQGIVHVIGPEQGFTLPGTTVVCCDSHTATHGAFGRPRLRHRHPRRASTCSPPRPCARRARRA